jgi:hypothetical protein
LLGGMGIFNGGVNLDRIGQTTTHRITTAGPAG